jgi:hypothetical protein
MIIFTATLSLMITVVVALAGVATSSGSIHSLGGHVVLSGHELSSLSAGKLFPSPIVVRIAGLLGFSMLLSACTWRLTSRGSQRVLTGSRHETTAQRLVRAAGEGSFSPASQLQDREKAASCLPTHRRPRRL